MKFVGGMSGLLQYLSALSRVSDLAKRPDGIGGGVDWHNVVETIFEISMNKSMR